MNNEQMRDLKHGEKIVNRDGVPYMVHNNYRSGEGFVVVVRTEVIRYIDAPNWRQQKKNTVSAKPKKYRLCIVPIEDGTEMPTVKRFAPFFCRCPEKGGH